MPGQPGWRGNSLLSQSIRDGVMYECSCETRTEGKDFRGLIDDNKDNMDSSTLRCFVSLTHRGDISENRAEEQCWLRRLPRSNVGQRE